MSVTVLFELPLRAESESTSVVQQTLAQTAAFPGNEGVEILVDDADPQRVVCVLRWASMADYDAYIAWRQTPAGAHHLFDVIDGPPTTRRFSATLPV